MPCTGGRFGNIPILHQTHMAADAFSFRLTLSRAAPEWRTPGSLGQGECALWEMMALIGGFDGENTNHLAVKGVIS